MLAMKHIPRFLVSAAVALAAVSAVRAEAPEKMSFAFGGDIMMGTTFPETPGNPYLPANDGKNLFDDVGPVLKAADVAAANFEGTMIDKGVGKAKPCSNPKLCFTFRMSPAYVANLTDAGIDLLSVANNHANDFGPDGAKATIDNLHKAGLAVAGNNAHAQAAVITRRGRKIGFAAFGHSRGTPSIMNLDHVRRIVENLASKCDIVVVSFHGGGEGKSYTHVPGTMETCFGENRGDVKAFAHAAVDAGADIVFGHGPHVTRGLELYGGRLIAYSLGNFVTPYRISLSGINSHAPVLTVNTDAEGRFLDGKIHSFVQRTGIGPRIDASGSVAAQMARLSREDFPESPLEFAADGTITVKK